MRSQEHRKEHGNTGQESEVLETAVWHPDEEIKIVNIGWESILSRIPNTLLEDTRV